MQKRQPDFRPLAAEPLTVFSQLSSATSTHYTAFHALTENLIRTHNPLNLPSISSTLCFPRLPFCTAARHFDLRKRSAPIFFSTDFHGFKVAGTNNRKMSDAEFVLSPWKTAKGVGRLLAVLLALTFAGFCICSLALLHALHRGHPFSGVRYFLREHAAHPHPIGTVSALQPNGTAPELAAQDLRRNAGTDLGHIVFGIGASAALWDARKEYVRTWWRRKKMRGFVWFDHLTPEMSRSWPADLPPWRISADTSAFRYTHKSPFGRRSAIRISRIVSETFRLGLPDVHWFVMGDDDTVFIAENLVTVLSKYDHNQFYYVGGISESHIQNQFFTYNMAFGGGGFAISYPLAKALERMQDRCLPRYESLFGSDDRVQACIAELGVTLTREPGFHQMDITGNPFGLLAAHPIAPLVTLHHLDVVEPIFVGMDRMESVRHLMRAGRVDPAGLLQQSVCYMPRRGWTVSVSVGYAVQIVRGFVAAREMEKPERTFLNWQHRDDFLGYPFNTRPVARHPCQRPFVFQMTRALSRSSDGMTITMYVARDAGGQRGNGTVPRCRGRIPSPESLEVVRVFKYPEAPETWLTSPRRNCCRVLGGLKNKGRRVDVEVGRCFDGEIISV